MKKAGLLIFMLVLSSIAAADFFTIGNGKTTQNFLPYEGTKDYGWSKIIYQASELCGAGLSAGPISGIGFQVANYPSGEGLVNQLVFIRHTQVDFMTLPTISSPILTIFRKCVRQAILGLGIAGTRLCSIVPLSGMETAISRSCGKTELDS